MSSDNWTPYSISWLEGAPFPATKADLIEWAEREGVPSTVVENLKALEDNESVYERLEDVWPEYESLASFMEEEEEEF